MSLVPKHF